MDRHQHHRVVEVHGKLMQAAGALVRATAPERNPGPVANDLDEVLDLLRIAQTQLAEARASLAADPAA